MNNKKNYCILKSVYSQTTPPVMRGNVLCFMLVFGKIGRVAPESVIMKLVSSQCFYMPLKPLPFRRVIRAQYLLP